MEDQKYTKVNNNSTSSNDIKKEIERLEILKTIEKNTEQAYKLLINSCYGATGAPYFIAYNTAVAEAITLQGQDIIKYASKVCDNYFEKLWPKDIELHKRMGIENVLPISKPVTIYNDTDSGYLQFNEIIQNSDWSGSNQEFILKVYEYRLKSLIEKNMLKYAEKFGTENVQQFELENISYSGVWLSKKKYVLDIAWKDPGIQYDVCEKISAKGVEIVRSSTPPFARKKMIDLVKYILTQKNDLLYGSFVELLNIAKREFSKQSNLDDICFSASANKYEDYVLNDTTRIELKKKCPIYIRAAAVYNYTVKKERLTNKYPLIKSGDKIKFFYTKDSYSRVFAYIPGEFPYDIDVSEMDKDLQFYKCIIKPVNRFIEVMGFAPVNSGLVVGRAIF